MSGEGLGTEGGQGVLNSAINDEDDLRQEDCLDANGACAEFDAALARARKALAEYSEAVTRAIDCKANVEGVLESMDSNLKILRGMMPEDDPAAKDLPEYLKTIIGRGKGNGNEA